MKNINRPSAFLSRLRSPDVLGVLARGTITAFLVQVAGTGIGYVVQVLLARWLGAGGFGNYSYLITWAQVFSIGALLGLDLGIVRFLPEYLHRQDHAHLCGILRWSRMAVSSVGIFLAGVSALVLIWIPPIRTETITLVLGSLLVPMLALLEVQTQIIRSTRRIGWAYAPPIILLPLILLGVTFVILRIHGGLTDTVSLLALIISLWVIIAVQGVVIQRIFSEFSKNILPEYDQKGWLRVSLPLLLNSIFSILLIRVDILIVGLFLGSEVVGVYSAAAKTAAIVGITLTAANTIVAPLVASYFARKDMMGLQEVASLAVLGSFWPSLVIGLAMILFGEPLLLVFGEEFVQARIPLIILILGQLVNVGSGSVGVLMVLTGYEKQSVFVVGVCALITGALGYVVVPSFGIIGAAVVSMLGFSLWNLWMHQLVVKYLGIHPSIFYAIRRIFEEKE